MLAVLLGGCLLAATPAFAQSDLTITKSHVGNFTQGQVGAQYTITVSNAGGPLSAGNPVTVVDTLPAGLAATDMAGTGWGCDVPALTCTNLNALNPGQSYPAITLTVTVAGNAPPLADNVVAVSVLGDTDTTNNSATDRVTINGATPQFLNVVSRKVHGAAGIFDLPLSVVTTNPTTEPRLGPNLTLVFSFDKPMTILAGELTILEGTVTTSNVQPIGNAIVLDFTAVPDQQYVTVALTGLASADGGTDGAATVRLGLLAGDVNQNRVVAVSDVGLVNQQVAQLVTPANFLKDVNATGTLTVADKGIVNTKVTHALPAP